MLFHFAKVPFCFLFYGGHASTHLLALYVGQTLCIDFSVHVPANFLTTLCSHMDVTCSCYFWSGLRMNVAYNYSCSFSQEKTEPYRSTVLLLYKSAFHFAKVPYCFLFLWRTCFHTFVGSVCRIDTMHRFLCSCSCKFPNYFVFTHGCYLFLLFLVRFKDERSYIQLQL